MSAPAWTTIGTKVPGDGIWRVRELEPKDGGVLVTLDRETHVVMGENGEKLSAFGQTAQVELTQLDLFALRGLLESLDYPVAGPGTAIQGEGDG